MQSFARTASSRPHSLCTETYVAYTTHACPAVLPHTSLDWHRKQRVCSAVVITSAPPTPTAADMLLSAHAVPIPSGRRTPAGLWVAPTGARQPTADAAGGASSRRGGGYLRIDLRVRLSSTVF